MAKFINITSWAEKKWSSPSTGSRILRIVSHPETDEDYFFKESVAKFPCEFWSEVIASAIGQLAGLDVLTYEVALNGDRLGCLSKSMTDLNGAELYHGVDVLRDYVPGFAITPKPKHSFQQLMTLCEKTEEFQSFKRNFIEMIIFDTLIGNTDRHTENWALLVTPYVEPLPRKSHIEPDKTLKYYLSSLFKKAISADMDEDTPSKFVKKIAFSPIYDSGSCLGREYPDNKVEEFLRDKNRIDSYINKSFHEVHWNKERVSSFTLVSNIIKAEPVISKEVLDTISQNLVIDKMQKIIDDLDADIVGKVAETYLSLQRKELVKTILIARLERLKKL